MKYRKLLIIVALLLLAPFLSIFSYKQYYNYKFDTALKEAAKIPAISWDAKYKSVNIKNKYRVILVLEGERDISYGEYVKYSAQRLGWDALVLNYETFKHENEILAFDPDFIIFSNSANPTWDVRINAHRSKKYMLSFASLEQLKQDGYIDKKDPYKALGRINDFNLLTSGVLTSAEIDIYKHMYKKLGKEFFGLRLLPVVPRTDHEPADPKRLMWEEDGQNLAAEHKAFIKKLSQNINMKAYGHYNSLNELKPGTYAGSIMPGMEHISAIRKNGIYLLKSFDNTASLKLFEALAANVIIISDKQKFIVDRFGGRILYYDGNATHKKMYKQIKAHLDWITANPTKAKAMAARAHEIFLSSYTLEKDLIRISRMHEYIVNHDKQRLNLEYPLGY